MADFINFEVDVEDDSDHDGEVSNDSYSDTDSIQSFIDNKEINNDVNFYGIFNNIETDIEQTLREEYEKSLHDVENFEEISNLCESSEDEPEIDNFKNAKEKIQNFSKEHLFPKTNN